VRSHSLGAAGLTVTPIGLGLAALGRPAYINLGRNRDLGGDRSVTAMEQRCHEMLDAAFSAGIRYVDAARSYGLAEQFLSTWLASRDVSPGQITIGSKWGYEYTGGWRVDATVHEEKQLSVEMLRRQLPESRAWLGNLLSVYQIHSATLESGVLEDRRVLSALAQLHESGLVIGLTVSGPRQADTIRRALDVDVDGVNPFQCIQATWNVLEPSSGPALAAAKAQGWGVIVKEALANGRLTDQHAGDELAALRGYAKQTGTSLDAVAIAAVLAQQPWVDVVLSGAVTPQQLQSHLSALSIHVEADAWPNLAEPPEVYWKRRSTLAWQ
jgi:aryl-alcohol dehydrogenase-like predicted oxidoreductase